MSLTTTRLNERRAIGSDAGAMRSSSRRLRRQGYTGAAQTMALEAEKARLGDRASRGGLMRSADEDIRAGRSERDITGTLMRGQRDQMLGGAGATEGAAGRGLQTGAGATEGAAGRGLQVGASGQRESFRDEEDRRRREVTLEGGFGRGAQMRAENLRDRQGLFAEMQGEGAADHQDEFRSRAGQLGVSRDQWNAATARMGWNQRSEDNAAQEEGIDEMMTGGRTRAAEAQAGQDATQEEGIDEMMTGGRTRATQELNRVENMLSRFRERDAAVGRTLQEQRERRAAQETQFETARSRIAERQERERIEDGIVDEGISKTKNTAFDVSTTSPTTREEKAESLRYGKNWREQVVARKEPKVFNAAVEAAGGKEKWDALPADEKTALLQRTKRYEALVEKAGGEEAFYKMSPSESKKLFDEIDEGLNF